MKQMSRDTSTSNKGLLWFVLLYTAASLLHFVHNAEFIDEYPNLPASLSRSTVYLTWLGIAAIGLLGCVLFRYGRQLSGLVLLGIYACIGFDGLLHYTRAPLGEHTIAMNVTIWLEALAAALLLLAVVRQATEFPWKRATD